MISCSLLIIGESVIFFSIKKAANSYFALNFQSNQNKNHLIHLALEIEISTTVALSPVKHCKNYSKYINQ